MRKIKLRKTSLVKLLRSGIIRAAMKFKTYLEKNKITEMQAAADLGCSQPAVNRYCHDRIPKPAMIVKIKEWSGGKVTERDWYSES